jgi:glycosyltransferase involved in cell wall biosynthesis
MRILNIMLAQVRGGVETMSVRYHEAISEAGFTVLSLGHAGGILELSLPPAEFMTLNALVNHDPFAAWRLRRIARDFKPDLILTHGNRATGISLLPFLGTASKTVQVVHNFRHKHQIARVRAAIAVSAAVHDNLKAAYPTLPIYDVANFGPLTQHPVKSAPSGVPVLGTLGRLHVNKGLDVAIKAMVRLRHEGIRVKLMIAGDGPQKRELMQLTQSLELESLIEFCGWVQPAADFLGTLDLFVMPSRVEPFGLVVTEAMAAGVPVVATAIDGPNEILRGGELGGLSAVEDPLALAEAIKAALGHWPVTLENARAAQTYALDHYSHDAGKDRLKATLEQIAQNHL